MQVRTKRDHCMDAEGRRRRSRCRAVMHQMVSHKASQDGYRLVRPMSSPLQNNAIVQHIAQRPEHNLPIDLDIVVRQE